MMLAENELPLFERSAAATETSHKVLIFHSFGTDNLETMQVNSIPTHPKN